MRTSSSSAPSLDPTAPSTEAPDALGLFEPIPRWELGYGNAGATEHWVDHPLDTVPWSHGHDGRATLSLRGRTGPLTWWQRTIDWLMH